MAANAQPADRVTDPGMSRRHDTAEARQAYLERLVRTAPPLSDRQRAKLGALLSPVAVAVHPTTRAAQPARKAA